MTRDAQRSKVYAAEDELNRVLDDQLDVPVFNLFGSTIIVPLERKFADLPSMQRYTDAVLRQPGRVTLVERKDQSAASYSHAHRQIRVPVLSAPGTAHRWAMRETVLLHEIAHHLTLTASQAHGPEFTARFMDLLTEHIGPEAGLLFKVFLTENGGH